MHYTPTMFAGGAMGKIKPPHLKRFMRQRLSEGHGNRPIKAFATNAKGLVGSASAPSTSMHPHFIATDQQSLFTGHINNGLLLGGRAKLNLTIHPSRRKR